MHMRLIALLITGILMTNPAWAQAAPSSSGDEPSSQPQDVTRTPEPQNQEPRNQELRNLPVSMDKIQQALSQPPALSLRGVNETTAEQALHFRMEVQEHQKIEELMSTLNFKSGPAVPGGLYAAEIQRLTHGSIDHPLEQPFAAFSTSELLTITLENLIGKYLGGRAISAVTNAERLRAEHAAREEVAQAMAEFCAEQRNGGAGLQGCNISSSSPAAR